MASSKKTGEEKAKRKTKPTNPENKNRKKQKPTSKKPKSHTTTTSNGAVKKPEVVVVPASSSSADSQQQEPESQQDSEQERENRTEEASHQRSKTKIPKKTTHNRDKDEDENNDEEEEKACRFPTRRIRRIVKSQSSGSSITGDAVFLVNKATEKFLEQFCEDGYAQCVKDRKKSLSYQHLASVVSKQRRYDFLSDFVPEKIKAEAALAESKLTEKGAG